jgi:hypothetical protein
VIRQFHGGFDHREREALHPVTVEPKVAGLDLGQAGIEQIRRGEPGHHLAQAILRQPEDRLIVPERVVGIEADHGDAHNRLNRPPG